MNHISSFCHRAVEIGHTMAAIPQTLASLTGRANAVAQHAFHSGVTIVKEIKHLWNLGPIQTTKNATKTFWAAAQIMRKPELVLQQLPHATNVLRYGAMTCSFYKDFQGQTIPFDLLAPESLNLLAEGTELTVMCSSSEKVTKKQVLDFMSKLTQFVKLSLSPVIDHQTANATAFKSLEFATTALGVANTAVTIYIYRNEIKDAALKAVEMVQAFNSMGSTLDQDMADADMTLDEMDQAGVFAPSQQEEPKTQPNTPKKVEDKKDFVEKEVAPVKKEVKRRGISNPIQSLIKKEREEIDRAVRDLEAWGFFDSLPPPPPKK